MDWFGNCIVLLGCVIEVLLVFDYFYNFFEIKIKRDYVKFIFIGTCSLLFGINMLGSAIINLFLFPALLWVFVTILFEARLGVRLGYFMIAYIVMLGVEFFSLILSEVSADMLSEMGVIPLHEYIWQLLLIKFINYIVFLILKQMSSRTKKHMTNKLFFIYLSVPAATIGIMITVYYSGIDFERNRSVKIILTLLFLFILIANIVLFYAFQKYTENLSEGVKQQIELMHKNAEIERLTKITEMNESFNEIVHNTSHYLRLIDQLAIENRNAEISDIVKELTDKLTKRDIYEYSNYKILNTILSEYSAKAENLGIKFDAYVEPGCVLNRVKDIDIVSILGNLFDNAITAASKKEQSSIIVRIFMHKNGKMCVIKIINDYVEELKNVNGKLISTKKEKGIHGIGVTSVSKTAERYQGFFSYYVENKKFNSVLLLPTE